MKRNIRKTPSGRFIESVRKKYGELHCEYCGKKNLSYKNTPHKATLDHFFPQYLYPDYLKRNRLNYRISCYTCNHKKGNQIWNFSEVKFPYPDNLKADTFQSLDIMGFINYKNSQKNFSKNEGVYI